MITPTVSSFMGKDIVILHLILRKDDGAVFQVDLFPVVSALWDDLKSFPNCIKDIRLLFPCYQDESAGEDPYSPTIYGIPRWSSIIGPDGEEIAHHGDEITYDYDREYAVSLDSFLVGKTRGYRYLFFDTETTGLPPKYTDEEDVDSYEVPRLVQLSWIETDWLGNTISKQSHIIKPNGFLIPEQSTRIHRISNDKANSIGENLGDVLNAFEKDARDVQVIVGHNLDFDKTVIRSEYKHLGRQPFDFNCFDQICTMKSSTGFCGIKRNGNNQENGYSFPSLSFLYRKLFGESFKNAHDSLSDADATMKCYWELRKRGVIDWRLG